MSFFFLSFLVCISVLLKHRLILYNEAELLSPAANHKSQRTTNAPIWLAYSLKSYSLRCHNILESDGCYFLFYFTSKQCLWSKWTISSGEEFTMNHNINSPLLKAYRMNWPFRNSAGNLGKFQIITNRWTDTTTWKIMLRLVLCGPSMMHML